MIDYKLLADNDPGGNLDTAYAAMSTETITTNPELMITYRKIGADCGLAVSAELEAAVKADANIPDWVNTALANDGINVNDPQVSATLASLVSAESATSISALGDVVELKYPNLKKGHLQNAREMRQEGRV